MAIYERAKTARRYFGLSADRFPVRQEGIALGSVMLHTDTGNRFIYDGDVWQDFRVTEIEVLEDILQATYEILAHAKVTRGAVAVMANDQSMGDFAITDD